MIVVMKVGASKQQVAEVEKRIGAMGFKSHPIIGEDRVVIGAIGHEKNKVDLMDLQVLEGVEAIVPISKPYKLASKEVRRQKTIIKLDFGEFGALEAGFV